MGKTFKTGILILFAAAVAALGARGVLTALPGRSEAADTSEGLSYLSALEAEDLAARKAAIAKKREKPEPTTRATPTEATPTEATPTDAAKPTAPETPTTGTTAPAVKPAPFPPVKDGNYRRAFRDVLIAGDSLVKAISEYDLLDEDQVIAKVGAHISYLEETTEEIVAAGPACLVLHYGENELDDPARIGAFTARYAAAIRTLQERLPDTVILVDSIFPVEDFALAEEPYLAYIDEYNDALREMCGELGVTYLDFTPLWQSFEKDYYDGDGIHPVCSFYTEQYLPFLISEVSKQ